MSPHINNTFAKKRGIGKKRILTIRAVMLEEHVDVVAGDFNGAAWRRDTSASSISIIEEAFADCALPMPPGPTPLWGPGAVLFVRGQTCVDFSSSQTQMKGGEYGNTVPFPFSMKLLACDRLIRAAVTRYGFMDFVEQRNGQAHHERHEERRLLLKERSAPYHCNKPKYRTGGDASDHSLFS